MEDTFHLKLVPPTKKDVPQGYPYSNPLIRFKGIISSLTENALECLNRISRKEMEKSSPSIHLIEEYYLLYHYLDFIRRMCQKKSTPKSP